MLKIGTLSPGKVNIHVKIVAATLLIGVGLALATIHAQARRAGGPDLAVSLSVECNRGDTRATLPYLYRATSVNQGTETAGSHLIRVFAARPDGSGVTLFEETIPSLTVSLPGVVITDPIPATVLATGKITMIQLVTDWNQTVAETNESNNSIVVPLPRCRR